ncbi:hypothetical protein DPMN_046667 [Dreissena polymorpha]|uniref:Uncharacterized protein n=1 Tax=Dreissena polymorpha TaxID=45954 RepID=A0A9D4HYE3_DREPO|nr:hypothetical protein DPMN_046667 [Dreissena polymorpha]
MHAIVAPTEAAEKVFDNCITSKKVDGGPNEKAEMFEVKYNFEFLDDLYSITHWKEKKKRKRGEPSELKSYYTY